MGAFNYNQVQRLGVADRYGLVLDNNGEDDRTFRKTKRLMVSRDQFERIMEILKEMGGE